MDVVCVFPVRVLITRADSGTATDDGTSTTAHSGVHGTLVREPTDPKSLTRETGKVNHVKRLTR